MGLREIGKNERRGQIVLAARALMQKSASPGFSMRDLAKESGLSIATPYNLFGSKQAIMFAVLDADFESYQARLMQLEVNQLERLFQSISVATTLFAEEPGFYRALLLAIYTNSDKEYRAMFSGPRQSFVNSLVEQAQQAGYLRRQINPADLARTTSYIFFSGILEWVGGLISLQELELRAQYGVGLSLAGAARNEYLTVIQIRVDQLQTQLQQQPQQEQQYASQRAT